MDASKQAAEPPGCLRMVLTTLALAAGALIGMEVWVGRYDWGVDDVWYRMTEANGVVTFGCQDFAPIQFTSTPAPGVTRILVLGGSSTFGFPERPTGNKEITRISYGFVGVMQASLDASWPDRFELVNLGVNGGASGDTLKIARRAMGWGAGGLIVYDGHNEFMGVPADFSPALWQFALYRRLAVLAPRTVESSGFLSSASYGGPGNAAAVVEQFRRNLQAVVDLGTAAGIPVVLATQAANLAGFDPSWSTTGELSALRGLSDDELETRFLAFPESADLAFETGHSRAARGREVGVAFQTALDNDGMPFRASSTINTVIRVVASDNGATLADCAAAVGVDGAVGLESFYDWVHPTPTGGARMAAALLDGMQRAGLTPGVATLTAPRSLTTEEFGQLETREAVAWLQWAMVRHHDPAYRLTQARGHAARARTLFPANPLATAVYELTEDLASGDTPRFPADPQLRTRVAAIHPRLRELSVSSPR